MEDGHGAEFPFDPLDMAKTEKIELERALLKGDCIIDLTLDIRDDRYCIIAKVSPNDQVTFNSIMSISSDFETPIIILRV